MTEINGTEGNDTLVGTQHDDLIDGMGGNDQINSRHGIDEVHGGSGDDTIYTFDGGDTIFPGTFATGDDKIYINDTTKNGRTTVDGTEFWADTVENALNTLVLGDPNKCHTELTEAEMRLSFDPIIHGCDREDFTVIVSTNYNIYSLYGDDGTLCKYGELTCPLYNYHHY